MRYCLDYYWQKDQEHEETNDLTMNMSYEQSHPEEAKKIEAEILELIKWFQESEDQWSSDVHRLYPTRQQWEEDPERSAFIHEVYERTGFSVRI